VFASAGGWAEGDAAVGGCVEGGAVVGGWLEGGAVVGGWVEGGGETSAGAIVIVRSAYAGSLTDTVNANVPDAVGVPLIVPSEFKIKPGGRSPASSCQV